MNVILEHTLVSRMIFAQTLTEVSHVVVKMDILKMVTLALVRTLTFNVAC